MELVNEILVDCLEIAERDLTLRSVKNPDIHSRIDYICRCIENRAGVRLLMSCMLARITNPEIDPRKPYTEINGTDCFSGRSYDEKYITHFIIENNLPCNITTAFLTPALRNINSPLTVETIIIGKPAQLYIQALQLLDDVANDRISAKDVLIDIIRQLIIIRNEKKESINKLLEDINRQNKSLPLSSEDIINLISQHLKCRNSSRLPVLLIAAAYLVVSNMIGEYTNPLKAHTSADKQTGALGDLEICLINDDNIVTIYEMKSKRVIIDDIDSALVKITSHELPIDNYIFITTDVIDLSVCEYAAQQYERTAGTEVVVLDCIGFLRHFMHFFHRGRIAFLDAYQELVLNEPDSAVNQPLKEAFLSLRRVAESA